MPPEAGPVLTVGHSTRTFEEFWNLLRVAGVGRLIDVRRFSHSPRHPWFDQEFLSNTLDDVRGVVYSHFPGLGGRRRPHPASLNTGWRNPSFRGYADHMATAEFRADFEWLVELCEGAERVCLMCSEAVWWRCHRRMISDALLVRDFRVDHLFDENRRMTHTLTPWVEVVSGTKLIYPGA